MRGEETDCDYDSSKMQIFNPHVWEETKADLKNRLNEAIIQSPCTGKKQHMKAIIDHKGQDSIPTYEEETRYFCMPCKLTNA